MTCKEEVNFKKKTICIYETDRVVVSPRIISLDIRWRWVLHKEFRMLQPNTTDLLSDHGTSKSNGSKCPQGDPEKKTRNGYPSIHLTAATDLLQEFSREIGLGVFNFLFLKKKKQQPHGLKRRVGKRNIVMCDCTGSDLRWLWVRSKRPLR